MFSAATKLSISAYSPISLFSGGQQGYWLDPSDFSTMFQDAAGTTPVTAVGQPVRLILDKSRGLVLGPELVTNGGPSFINTNGWTATNATLSVVGGRLRIQNTSTNLGVGQTTIPTVAGKYYEISFSYVLAATGSSFRVGSTSFGTELYNASVAVATKVTVLATTSTTYLSWRVNEATAGAYIDITSVSARELPGNHFTQSSTSNAPILGRNPIVGTRNLLTRTEEFENAAWAKSNATVTANGAVAPDGTMTADKAVPTATTAFAGVSQFATTIVGTTYTFSAYAKMAEWRYVTLSPNGSADYAVFDLQNGSVAVKGASTTASIQSVDNGWYRCTLSYAEPSAASRSFAIFPNNTGTFTSQTGNGTSGIFIWGAQLETGSTATAYQRVGSAFDVTQAGVPDVYYLAFDGTDDWLQSQTITPGTDKAQVFAGVRKLSAGTATAIIAESSASAAANAGSIRLVGPSSIGENYFWGSAGTGFAAAATTANSYIAPITNVLTGIGDIANDTAILRINGTQAASSAADQGTGNYLAYPHYIGRRGGTSLPFNGRLYQLITRYGANLTAGQIAATETFVNQRTGAY